MSERNDLTSKNINTGMVGLSQSFGTAREVLAKYTHCAVCDAYLHFTHVTDFSRNLTQETARCPECGLRALKLMHRLQ